MAYRIDHNQPLSDELRRIVCEQIDRALMQLAAVELAPQDAIHQARKNCKKIRAVLRLVRDDLGEHYAQENGFYRDLAGSLRDLRDADVLLQRFDELVALRPRLAAAAGIRRIREQLTARRDGLLRVHGDLCDLARSIAEKLAESRERVFAWTARPFGVEALDRGFRRIYRRGRKAMDAAFQEPTLEHLHEWRKAAKYHWYHTRLLRAVWPKHMEARRRRLGELANLLGEDHDLSILIRLLTDPCMNRANSVDVNRVVRLAEQRRELLREPIVETGERIYEIKAGFLSRRLQSLYKPQQ